MKILVTGASGLIGNALVPFLVARGHEVVRLGRTKREGFLVWDPANESVDDAVFKGCDAVVHLAGANIAAGRWTAARKREILESRTRSTRFLVGICSRMSPTPSVLVSASAAGYYGDTGDLVVDEDAPAGRGFLADVCRQWEEEAVRAEASGIRVVRLRTGAVLTPHGGALAKLLPIFRAGLGGPAGSGRQWISWIAIDDLVAVVLRGIEQPEWRGPVNAVTPEPVQNAVFSKTIGRVLGKPSAIRAPSFALKVLFGEMAQEAILASCRVRPRRLVDAGFQFRHPDLEEALRYLLE